MPDENEHVSESAHEVLLEKIERWRGRFRDWFEDPLEQTVFEQDLTIRSLQKALAEAVTDRDRYFKMKRETAGRYADVREVLQQIRVVIDEKPIGTINGRLARIKNLIDSWGHHEPRTR